MERIEVTHALEPVTMPARLLNEIHEHARALLPEECCGLVLGGACGEFADVQRCHNDMTKLNAQDPRAYPRTGRRAFHMREQDYLRVVQEAAAKQLRVTAVYHSHVNEGLYFSEDDQAYALQPAFPFPDAWHIVVSVVDKQVKASGVFTRCAEGEGAADARFVGRVLLPELAS